MSNDIILQLNKNIKELKLQQNQEIIQNAIHQPQRNQINQNKKKQKNYFKKDTNYSFSLIKLIIYYNDNKDQEAIKLLDAALLIDPRHVNSLNLKGEKSYINILADSLIMIGNYNDAIIWADKALTMNSKHVYSLYSKGIKTQINL